ncbi:uncharacterized protein LOC126655067 [Mercurialis annua]|uniref:uncharacterized protein LOC126655067 n=1 Tax=Mercurialis annua TaxID=3986 RepID=UPI00215ED058|nr:uncharacterized protein LOC126655067 [Mercurialis annua]
MLIQTNWKKLALVHYNKTLHKWRKNWKKKEEIPQGVKDDVWATWLIKWESEDWKKKSEKARKNRLSKSGGSGTGIARHTGGFKSILEHTKSMEIENGGEVDPWEVHKKLHKRKDGKFVDSKSSTINDKMEIAIAIASQLNEDGSMPVVDIRSIYYDVVGGENKKRVYGLGSQASVFYPRNCSYASSSGCRSDDEHTKQMIEDHFNDQQQNLTQQLDTLREQQESLRKYQDTLHQQQEDLVRREQGLHDTLQLELSKRQQKLEDTMLLRMQEMWKNMQKGVPPSGEAEV